MILADYDLARIIVSHTILHTDSPGLHDAKHETNMSIPKHAVPLAEGLCRLRNRVFQSIVRGHFPLIIGGDHSQAVGTISGALHATNGRAGVVWIDRHPDMHTVETTVSRHANGLPLAILFGDSPREFTPVLGVHKLLPVQTIHIGANDIDEGEKAYISQAVSEKHLAFVANEVGECYSRSFVDRAYVELREFLRHTPQCFVSFDIDATNVPAVNPLYLNLQGMEFSFACDLIDVVDTYGCIVGMEVVEYMSSRDSRELHTARGIVGAIKRVLCK